MVYQFFRRAAVNHYHIPRILLIWLMFRIPIRVIPMFLSINTFSE